MSELTEKLIEATELFDRMNRPDVDEVTLCCLWRRVTYYCWMIEVESGIRPGTDMLEFELWKGFNLL